MLIDHLAQAEAHLALGLEQIEKQRRLISELMSRGADTASARELLQQLEETQVLHEAGRDRIQQELDANKRAEETGGTDAG